MQLVKTIVIKPTLQCNLRCEYCYEFRRNSNNLYKDKITIEQLTDIVWRIAKLFPDSKILWMFHGGEPLLCGSEYLEKFANCIREVNSTYPVDYKIALQTNATLLSDECIQVLEKNADLLSERIVSISIDGPKEINDITRNSISGNSSYNNVESSIQKIRNSELAFSTISVIGTHNIDQPQKMFAYVKGIGANLCKFLPNYNSDSNGNSEMYGINPLDFAKFMIEIFDLWMHDLPNQTNKRLIIEPIASIICALSNSKINWCEYQKEKCSNFTCIYPNGDMWLCDNYANETMRDTAYLKNIYNISDEELKNILLTPNKVCEYAEFYNKIMGICSDCEIYDFCKGGCIQIHYDMLKKSDKLAKEFCEAKKLLINHIKRAIDLALS